MTDLRSAVLVAVLASAIAASLCKPALGLERHPDDDGSTTIVFGGVAYDLPTSDVGRERRRTSSINLLLMLPDMKPVPPAMGADTAHGLGNKLLLLYEYDIEFFSADEQFRHLLKNAHLNEKDAVGDVGNCRSYVGNFITSQQVLYCSLDEHRYVVQCFFKDSIVRFPDCFSMQKLADKISATMYFSRDELSRLPAIEAFVTNYLPVHRKLR